MRFFTHRSFFTHRNFFTQSLFLLALSSLLLTVGCNCKTKAEDEQVLVDAPAVAAGAAVEDDAANEDSEGAADGDEAAPSGGSGLQLQLGGSAPTGYGSGSSPRLLDGELRGPE